MIPPHHILTFIGCVIIVVGIFQTIYLGKAKSPVPVRALRVEACSFEDRIYKPPTSIKPGDTHRIAFASILNDPHPSRREDVEFVTAKLTYFDSGPQGYLTVDMGLWSKGQARENIPVGTAERLVIAIVDSSGSAFTVDHQESWSEGTSGWFKSFVPNQVKLRNTTTRVLVQFSYQYADHIMSLNDGQSFTFSISLGKELTLKSQ
jgi:hypothetical protein